MTSALVLGGSIAGLLAAAALAPHVDTVTLVERDDLLDPGRRGVPQGAQVHALLGAGQRAMAELLPGIVAEFLAAGGTLVDSPYRVAIFGANGWAGRMPSKAEVVFMRRPALEAVVCRRVLDLPNVLTVPAAVTGLLGADGRSPGERAGRCAADGRSGRGRHRTQHESRRVACRARLPRAADQGTALLGRIRDGHGRAAGGRSFRPASPGSSLTRTRAPCGGPQWCRATTGCTNWPRSA